MPKQLIVSLAVIAAVAAAGAQADTVTVTVSNLTQGLYFTPVLVAAHPSSADVFEAGTLASANLQAMAEGGSIAGLSADMGSVGAVVVENPAGGLLAPGSSATAVLQAVDLNALSRLSVVAMMLPTNDAFIGLDSLVLAADSSTTLNINAYDAGTEINNELIVAGAGGAGQIGIPADPSGAGGTAGTGVQAAANGNVHIHPGALGDRDNAGGMSDLDSRVHRWLNPVARITVSVSQ